MSPRNLDECVVAALSSLDPDIRERFANDPKTVMEFELDLTVTPVNQLNDQRADGGACDGVSFLNDSVVLYAPTGAGNRRENFTLAHELGHWLVDRTPRIYDWVADQDHAGKLLETICDRIAQRLLLPDSILRQVIGDGPVRAHHVIDLYEASHASHPVAAIGLAGQLTGLGVVAIIDRATGEVTTASVRPDPERGWPRVFPWRGDQITSTDPLMRMDAGATSSTKRQWATPWGTAAEFYIDAFANQRRIIVVFSDTDLWDITKFHAPQQRTYDDRPNLRGHCCGTAFEIRGYSCSDCRQPYCPQCGDCRCQRQAKNVNHCTSCFSAVMPHLIVDGLCDNCR